MRWSALGVGDRRGVVVSPEEASGKQEADLRPASGSELGRAANAAGGARAQREPPARAAGAKNGRARWAWVDGDEVPVGHTCHLLTAKEGEGLRISTATRRRLTSMVTGHGFWRRR